MRSVLPHGCTGVCATGIDDAGPGEYGEMDKGWTNLVNEVEQTFTPSLTKLVGVEVQLVLGNAGAAEDHLTLTFWTQLDERWQC